MGQLVRLKADTAFTHLADDGPNKGEKWRDVSVLTDGIYHGKKEERD